MIHSRQKLTIGGGFALLLTLASWSAISDGQTPASRPPPPNAVQRGANGSQTNGRPQVGSPIEQLGRAIFFDKNISNPPGMACASCHAPEAGFSYPVSQINQNFGVVPGVNPGRFGNRKPMTISYAWFTPEGPPEQRRRRNWEGGIFSDGRAESLDAQAAMPMENPNEMDNTLHGVASPEMVVRKVMAGSYLDLFKRAFGDYALTKSTDDTFRMIRRSIAAFERSREVSPFSSKYDAVMVGQAQFTVSEGNGLKLFTGSVTGRPGGAANYKDAQCVTCHRISADDDRRDFFTNWTYANIGVPKNPRSPYYKQTKSATDPLGFNPDGDRFVDLGLGANLYPASGLPAGNIGAGSDGRGDYLGADGLFRVSSLRNVDKRPSPGFVKCYMHNGVFKSLKEVVHFYNTRNLTTTGDVIDLSGEHPFANVKGKPLWPAPEVASDTLQNAAGRPSGRGSRVGNLGLTDQEENEIVAFLQTLSDGYFTPARRRPPPN